MKGQWWQTLNLKPYIPDNEKKGRGLVVMNGTEVSLGDGVYGTGLLGMFFRLKFRHDGSKINRCIQRVTNGQMAMPWAGPFIAFKYIQGLNTAFGAVMSEDMPALTQYFRTGFASPAVAEGEARKKAWKEARKEARAAWRNQ